MKCRFLLLLFFCSNSLFSQDIEVSSGLCINSFYDTNDNENNPRFNSYYSPSKAGYSFSGSLNIKIYDSIPLRFSLRYYSYEGTIYNYYGSLWGLAGYSEINANVTHQYMGLDLHWMNFKILNNLNFNFGFELNYLLSEKLSGYKINTGPYLYEKINLNDSSIQFGKKFVWGIVARLAYELNLGNQFYLVPQYQIYYSFLPQLNSGADTKSLRHYFEIGIGKRFGK
jgi:hypothetical protein